jgi:hypothetical protein
MVVNLYTTKCLHPAQVATGAFNKDSPMELHEYYTDFLSRSRLISATIIRLGLEMRKENHDRALNPRAAVISPG